MGYDPITKGLRSHGATTAGDGDATTRVFDDAVFADMCDQIDTVHAALEIENTSLRARLVAAEADAKTQRNNFDQATSAREHWKRLYEAEQNECERLAESVRQLEGERDEEHDRVNWLNAELKGLEDRSVELPLDADGEPVRIGDVMVYADGNTCPLPVVALVPPAVFLTDDGPRYADMCRHHTPDTWERIIEDAVNVHGNGFNPFWTDERDALIARCRALAGEEQ